MKILMAAIALATILGPVSAEEDTLTKVDKDIVWRQPVIPSEEEKRAALLIALKLRGSFSGYGGMVDLTDPATLAAYSRAIATDATAPEGKPLLELPKPKLVQTTKEGAPDRADIYRRHGMRKVVTGTSWRCRK